MRSWSRIASVSLVLLLQRAPLLRLVAGSQLFPSVRVVHLLQGALAGAFAASEVDAQAGATMISPAFGEEGNPGRGVVGQSFQGAVAIVGAPLAAASYRITGELPPGLEIEGLSGFTFNGIAVPITGTPTEAGSYTLFLQAWNRPNLEGDGGQTVFDYQIIIEAGDSAAPVINTQPSSRSISVGGEATFTVVASGNPSPTYQWQKDNVDIEGATDATLTLSDVASGDAGQYAVVVSNSLGDLTSSAATLTVTEGVAINITSPPRSADVVAGTDVNLSVIVDSGGESVDYQWFRFKPEDGLQSLADATNSNLMLTGVQAADMGIYFVRVSSGDTSVDSPAAIVTLTGGTSRLANLSTRGSVPAGSTLTPGFVLRGSGAKPLVIRAVGPTLADFGVNTAMSDPTMALIPLRGADPVASNNDWEDASNSAELVTASSAVGAFPLSTGSQDAAMLADVALPNAQGNTGYTVQIQAVDGASGIALAEVYDPEGLGTGAAQLTNISARGFSGQGAEALSPGFVIDGTGAKTMLIRVVGPTLTDFEVPDTMADPVLEVIPGGQTFVIAANDNWGGSSELKDAFATTGAFGFADDGSRDAAVLVRLPPGSYTVRPSGVDDTVGVILVEAYEVLE